jgi:hypothetical protein
MLACPRLNSLADPHPPSVTAGAPEWHYLDMPLRLRNYWTYSIGWFVAWGIVLAIVSAARRDKLSVFVLVFAGASIGWASGTIARYAYPPPRRWRRRS